MVTITSIAGGAPKPVFDRLGPVFEQRSGHRLNALYDTMSGIADRVTARARLDVLLMPVPLLEAYVRDGIVLAGSIAPLAKIGLGVGVRAGAAVPDISTSEKFRAALLAANSVVHAPPGATPSGAHSDRLIRELGLEDALAGRVIHKAGVGGGVAMIARGEVGIGMFPKSEIANATGVTLAGDLPAALQSVTVYGAGVTAASPVAGPAAEFIRFLTEPDSRHIWLSCGFDPPA
jgi:molybdate transport system substrate-binding protein